MGHHSREPLPPTLEGGLHASDVGLVSKRRAGQPADQEPAVVFTCLWGQVISLDLRCPLPLPGQFLHWHLDLAQRKGRDTDGWPGMMVALPGVTPS